jgi:hypothetical protein
MKCPKCGAQAPAEAAECAACGAIFAKLKELKEREKREVEAALKAAVEAEPEAPPRRPWLGRAIALAVIVGWMVFLAFYIRSELAESRRRALDSTRPRPVRVAP